MYDYSLFYLFCLRNTPLSIHIQMHMAAILNFLIEILSQVASNSRQTLMKIFSDLSLSRFKKTLKFSENYKI